MEVPRLDATKIMDNEFSMARTQRTTNPVVCVGRAPCLTPVATAAYGDWRVLRHALVNVTSSAAPFCPRRLSGVTTMLMS